MEKSMTETNKKLSRREAIKIVGAAAGASLLANIPAKWSKPELTGASMPAHAQTSSVYTYGDAGDSCPDFALIARITGVSGSPRGMGSSGSPSPIEGAGVRNQVDDTISWDCSPACIKVWAEAENVGASVTVQFTVMGTVLPDVTVTYPNWFGIHLDSSTGLYATSTNYFFYPAVGNCLEYLDD